MSDSFEIHHVFTSYIDNFIDEKIEEVKFNLINVNGYSSSKVFLEDQQIIVLSFCFSEDYLTEEMKTKFDMLKNKYLATLKSHLN